MSHRTCELWHELYLSVTNK